MKRIKYKKNGFTLIELIVVLAIVGILVVIGANGVRYGIIFSHDQSNKEYTVEVSQALEKFYSEFNYYPTAECTGSNSGFDNTQSLTQLKNVLTGTYGLSASDAAYSAYSSAIAKIGASDASRYGYCSSYKNTSAGSGAYILLYETQGSAACQDNAKNYFFALGNGYYTNLSSIYRNYYDISTDYTLTFSTPINCFKTS